MLVLSSRHGKSSISGQPIITPPDSTLGSIVIRLGLAITLISLWVVVQTDLSHACTCILPGSPVEELAESSVVFKGRVVSLRHYDVFGKWSSTDPTRVEFDVGAVWKGPLKSKIYLTTARIEASCGYSFQKGVEYLVYSRDGATISLCSRTRPLGEAHADLAQLGKGRVLPVDAVAPAPDTSSYRTGSCGQSQNQIDISVVGLMLGLAWFGLRKRYRVR